MNFEKGKHLTILSFILKPISIAAILTLIFFVVVPIPNRYLISKLRSFSKYEKTRDVFYDLNYDGNSEHIGFQTDPLGVSNFIVFDQERLIDQWRIKGEYIKGKPFFIADYNNDKYAEIYTLSQKNDSVFLNVIDPFHGNILIKDLFLIESKSNIDGDFETNTSSITLFEQDGDPNKELIISFFVGYSITPRQLVAIDLDTQNKTITNSTGVNYTTIIVYDLENDGKDEIFGPSPSHGNTSPDFELSDQYAWLYFYDADLQYSFQPKIIGKCPALTTIFPVPSKNKDEIIVAYGHSEADDESWIAKYDRKGNLLKKYSNPIFDDALYILFDKGKDFFFVYQRNGIVVKINYGLNVLWKRQLNIGSHLLFSGNIFKNFEYIFTDPTGQLTIYNSNFSNKLDIPFEKQQIGLPDISLKYNNLNHSKELVLSFKDELAFFKIYENWFYWLHFPFLVLFFLLIWLLIHLIYLTQKKRVEKELGVKQKIAELQIRSLHNQLDPHFTLNLINSIGSLFSSQKAEEANYYFGKYAKLLREMILNSDKIEIPLKDEIEYCKNYLQLEQFRMNNKFEFVFKIGNNVNLDLMIPRLLMHSFIENSIKHGIRHLLDKIGLIEIEIKMEEELIISIKDNGVGRKKASTYSSMSTGKGLEIVNETIKNYQSLKNRAISYTITDIINSKNEVEGTQIELCIQI